MSVDYPLVPLVPGVPAVLSSPDSPLQIAGITATLVTSDAISIAGLFAAPQWGLFDSTGVAVLVSDTVRAVEYRREAQVSQAQQEQGAFQSYNKVQEPFDARVTFSYSGNGSALDSLASGGIYGQALTGINPAQDNRAQFLGQLEDLIESLDLISVYTPEIQYDSANVVHFDYRRTVESGTTMLTVDVWLEEIRVTGTVEFSNTAAPSGANLFNNGTVQPASLSTSQSATIEAGGVY